MKKILAIAVLSLSAFSSAHANVPYGPDRAYTTVECTARNGVAVRIMTGGFIGRTFAQIAQSYSNGRIAPVATIPAVQYTHTQNGRGFLDQYVGAGFKLEISPSKSDGFSAHLTADVQGRVYNQDLTCQFFAVPMSR